MTSFKSFVSKSPPRIKRQAPCVLPDDKVARILGTSYQEPEASPTAGNFDNAKFQRARDMSIDNGRGTRTRNGAPQGYIPGDSREENIRQWSDRAIRQQLPSASPQAGHLMSRRQDRDGAFPVRGGSSTAGMVGMYDGGKGKPEGTFKTGPTDSPYSQARGTLKAWAKHASANSYGSKRENVRSSIHRKP
jgi:hypothetical protein